MPPYSVVTPSTTSNNNNNTRTKTKSRVYPGLEFPPMLTRFGILQRAFLAFI